MAAATAPAVFGLVPRLVFGFASSVRENLHYLEDGSTVHPAGATVVITAPDGRSHRFLPGSVECEGISALCLSPNRRLLAVAERADKAVISVYDLQTLRRRKQLVAADVGSKEYVSLCFSPDGKLLLAQGGGPDWSLLLWAWEKSKVACSVRSTNLQGSPVVQASISPGESGLVTVIGAGVLKMFKLTEQALKPLPLTANRRDSASFTCMAWAGASGDGGGAQGGGGADGAGKAAAGSGGDRARQLLGTQDGEVLMFEGTEPRTVFAVSEGRPIQALAAYSKGFVAGLDGGLVCLFDRDDREHYRRSRTFSVVDHALPVRSLAISASEEQLALSLAGGPAFTLALNNQELMKADDMNFELLGPGVHTAAVTGLDMCVRRPLVATCSLDRSVRLWNYADRSCELVKAFPEEAHSIAVHPSGLQVLVGFADKLRLMNVLIDDLRLVKEVAIKGCRDVCFSDGGQYFAAVNGITISVYSTYTCECLGNLRGHNSKVRAVCWAAADTRLVSAGADGAVYEWRLSDLKREKENVLKGCQYSAVVATLDTKTLIAAGSDRKIKELEESPGAGTQVTREMETQSLITALALPNGGKVLFAATELGSIRCYKYPLTGEFYEVKCHEGPIARLRVSYDDCLLLSAGDDGAVVLLDICDKELAKASSRQALEKLPWCEEVLVSKGELEERSGHVAELEQQVAELTMQNEYQLRLKDLHVQERVKELSDRFGAELEADRARYEALATEKGEQELAAEEKLKQAEARHAAQLAALDGQYQGKLMAEVERYQALLQEKEAMNERWDDQNALLVESHERVIRDLSEEAEARLALEVLAAQSLQQDKEALIKEAAETKRQLEEDADREIEELKERYEQRLAGEREAALRLKGENGIMRKKFQALQKDIDEQREQLATQHEQQRELYTAIKGLEKDIGGLKREIRERDETIGDKERRIYELKKKNQELEKFKFVLDYKIKELKNQIEPREVEVGQMRETIHAMDAELERYHRSNAGLDLTIQKLRLKETGLQGEVIAQRGARADTQARVRRLQCEIAELAEAIPDPKALRDKVKAMYQRHCVDADGTLAAGELSSSSAGGADLGGEYARQRAYLEKTIEGLKHKLAAGAEAHRTNELRIMGQNASLIRELNELRREIKVLKSVPPARSGGVKTTSVSVAARAAAATSGTAAAAGKPAGSRSVSRVSSIKNAAGSAVAPRAGAAAPSQQQQQQSSSLQVQQQLEMQQELIAALQAQLTTREARLAELEAASEAAAAWAAPRQGTPLCAEPALSSICLPAAAASEPPPSEQQEMPSELAAAPPAASEEAPADGDGPGSAAEGSRPGSAAAVSRSASVAAMQAPLHGSDSSSSSSAVLAGAAPPAEETAAAAAGVEAEAAAASRLDDGAIE